MPETLSVIVITHNEEKNIRRCLESVSWADEKIVVDAESEDATRQIAEALGAKVFVKPWPGYAAQKRFALQRATGEWALSIDADEEVSKPLANQIQELLNSSGQQPAASGYRVFRLSQFLGKWVPQKCWSGPHLCLFRREQTKMPDATVHEGFTVEGRIGFLKGPLLHYTHRTLAESLAINNRYTTLDAKQKSGRVRIRWFDFLLRPLGAFLTSYFWKGGMGAGRRGLLIGLLTALSRFSLCLKLYKSH